MKEARSQEETLRGRRSRASVTAACSRRKHAQAFDKEKALQIPQRRGKSGHSWLFLRMPDAMCQNEALVADTVASNGNRCRCHSASLHLTPLFPSPLLQANGMRDL